MSWSDSIADMLTRIRNAHRATLEKVEVPHSKLKGEIARILKKEGFISDYLVEGGSHKTLRMYLKYTARGESVIRGIKRESKAGLRRYVARGKAPMVLGGMGIAIISTSKGVMTGKDAVKQGVGGELICTVW